MFPKLSTFESRLFTRLSTANELLILATVSDAHPKSSGELNGKGRVTIQHLNSLTPKMSRLGLDAAYQFACWDFSTAKSRRLQEIVIESIESWQVPSFNNQNVQAPSCERISGIDFSPSSQLYFSTVVFRFPILKTV